MEVKHEPRVAVMILVEASWEDQSGGLQTTSARIENKSVGGACIRVPIPIAVGSRLTIQSRREQFSGIAKYCVSEGMEYLVGIHRDAAKSAIVDRPVAKSSPVLKGVSNSNSASIGPNQLPTTPELQENKPIEMRRAGRETEVVSVGQTAGVAIAIPDATADHKVGRDAPRTTKPRAKQHSKEKQAGNEGTSMRRSWLESGLWNNKPKPEVSRRDNGSDEGLEDKGSSLPQEAPVPKTTIAAATGEGVASFRVESLPMEDIYCAAGIVNPRRGYGINKVVEMLHSEHVRGLSKEMKRAAVLMALDVAGISVDEVLIDARARQNALNSYETRQKKQVEAEWARKAEEHVQIQADLERVKEQYAARISRHLNAVLQQKAAFNSWQALKKQECQDMSEAAELCLKCPVSEPVRRLPGEARMAASNSGTA